MKKTNEILVTGGAGYIGSHTVISLINLGYEPIVVDDFSNSQPWIINQIKKITGKKIQCYTANCTDKVALEKIFKNHHFQGIIHFAAYKSVGESVENPKKYYQNNVGSTECLLELMDKHNIKNLIFSSSCTVYGKAENLPVTEYHAIKQAESPYGLTKQVCEKLILNALKSNRINPATILRYFNPIGAHESSLIGELPLGTPNNLVPFITQTAAGIRKELTVFGDTYNTKDGTCIRDYIHVMDLAEAHVQALMIMQKNNKSHTLNIGTGKGTSVLEAIESFEKVNHIKLKYKIGAKREGDIEEIYASTKLAEKTLNWKAKRNVDDAMKDAWNWQNYLNNK